MPGRDRLWRPRTPSIADLLAAGDRPLFSFEFFPPKDEIQQRQLWQAVRELESLGPDFVSVTYGASGSTRDRTIKATEAIAQHTTLRAMAHLTCASQSRDQLRRVIGCVRGGRHSSCARDPRRHARRSPRAMGSSSRRVEECDRAGGDGTRARRFLRRRRRVP